MYPSVSPADDIGTSCDRCGTPLLRGISQERGTCAECHNRRRFPEAWAQIDRRQAMS